MNVPSNSSSVTPPYAPILLPRPPAHPLDRPPRHIRVSISAPTSSPCRANRNLLRTNFTFARSSFEDRRTPRGSDRGSAEPSPRLPWKLAVRNRDSGQREREPSPIPHGSLQRENSPLTPAYQSSAQTSPPRDTIKREASPPTVLTSQTRRLATLSTKFEARSFGSQTLQQRGNGTGNEIANRS